MPEASGSALEQVLKILCKPWNQEELTLSLDQITVFQVLGIPVGFSVNKEDDETSEESSQHLYSEASKEINQKEINQKDKNQKEMDQKEMNKKIMNKKNE